MAFDEGLAQRIRDILEGTPGLEEKKMFGGIGFLVFGNMACGVHKNALIVRVGPARYSEAVGKPHTKPFDMTGRPMTGWVMVDPDGCRSEEDLDAWVQQGVEFVGTLPKK